LVLVLGAVDSKASFHLGALFVRQAAVKDDEFKEVAGR